MTYRSGVGSYRYGAERPHAVTNASNNGGPTEFLDYKYNLDFQYDANGNLMVGAGRLYTWNSFNKPEQIQRGAEGSRFEYDADRARVLEVQTRITDNLRQVTQILTSGVYERRITTNGILQDRVHVTAGGEMVAVLTAAAADVVTPGTSTTMPTALYMHVDHQGNVEAVTDQTGATVDRTSFDPFGARRLPTWAADPDYTESKRSHPTDRGYTGHHQPDHLQLIHMNGRVYDPYLARFISADPYIQDPSNIAMSGTTQSTPPIRVVIGICGNILVILSTGRRTIGGQFMRLPPRILEGRGEPPSIPSIQSRMMEARQRARCAVLLSQGSQLLHSMRLVA